MKFTISTLAVAAMLAQGAVAHTTLQWFWPANSQGTSTQSCVRQPPNNNPIEDVTSSSFACNINGNVPASSVCSVTGGSTVKIEWHHTNRAQGPTDGDDPIASSHKGPIIVYLAKVDNAATATNTASLDWFKIQQEGLNGGVWAVDKLNQGNGEWDVKIPSNIPNGDYLLRGEIIALHSAGNYPGAQFYMGCIQIRVSGASGGTPSPVVKFPGAYSGTHPGIKVSIYGGSTSYSIPGPALFSSTGNNGGGVVNPPASSVVSSAPPAATTATSGTVPKYGQCGGIGYTGPTGCVSGSTCTKTNDYYSQCL
ncbi:endoglucanase II [Peziza echinospora]|nr:endoglucanase II [Peziza echinospora]